MGYLISYNIHQRMLQNLSGHTPELLTLDPIPPMIGLAVGHKAVAYDPEGGMKSGEDVMKLYFGDDLGFSSKLDRTNEVNFAKNNLSSLLELDETWRERHMRPVAVQR